MLLEQTESGIAHLALDRPQRANALSADLVEALLQGLHRALNDTSVHTVCLRSTGAHFCTGLDLGGLDSESDGDLLLRVVRIEALLADLWQAPVRTVALASGRAWGAGADLFAACEVRIATEESTFRFPGAGFGLVLGSRRLAERVGVDRARRWVIEGHTVNAREALDSGLVTQIVEPEAVREAVVLAGIAQPPAIDSFTAAAVRRATRTEQSDADLAHLVRSASRPGLKARILEYAQRRRST
jgi:enoyl-CoA hydratase